MVSQAIRIAFLLLPIAAVTSAQAPAGGEFRVNTYTTGRQMIARPAMEPDGDFVVVWNSFNQDGNSDGVFGQRFAASGAPRGNEFQINIYTPGPQLYADIAVGSDGDFVVVWGTVINGSIPAIQGRRYDTAGSPVGADFFVNSAFGGSQSKPHVGRAADGRFVVSWDSDLGDGSAMGIVARRFDASGIPLGSEFVVNAYTTGLQRYNDLAVAADGTFVAVWEDYDNNRDGLGSAIFGQRFDASGNRLGSEFQVNSYTTDGQRFPTVSVSPAGGFAVVWQSDSGDGSGFAMFGRAFDASGNAVGNDFVVNSYTTGSQYGIFGGVAHDGAGNFVVTWQGRGAGDSYGTHAQRFSAAGLRLGAEFRVNTYTTGAQFNPSLASDAAGNFVVVWQSFDGSDYGIFAQRYGDLIFEDGFDSGALSP